MLLMDMACVDSGRVAAAVPSYGFLPSAPTIVGGAWVIVWRGYRSCSARMVASRSRRARMRRKHSLGSSREWRSSSGKRLGDAEISPSNLVDDVVGRVGIVRERELLCRLWSVERPTLLRIAERSVGPETLLEHSQKHRDLAVHVVEIRTSALPGWRR